MPHHFHRVHHNEAEDPQRTTTKTMIRQSKGATDNLFLASERVLQPAVGTVGADATRSTTTTPSAGTCTDTITAELCQHLTACITSLHRQARELRVVRACRRNPTLRQRLFVELEQSLTAVEERTQALVDVVNAEQDAVRRLRAQYQIAQQQHQHLLSFQENIPNYMIGDVQTPIAATAPLQERPDTTPPTAHTNSATVNATSTNDLLMKWNRTRNQQSRMDSVKDECRGEKISHGKGPAAPLTHQQIPDKKLAVQQQHQNPGGMAQPHRHHHHPFYEHHQLLHQQQQQPKRGLTDPITMDELEQIPRTTRGRISLYVLNDALSDIAAHCRRRARKKTNHRLHSQFSSSSSSVQSPPYPVPPVDAAHLVEEQELRQSCSFFRTGESTARSILLILRTLGRLQQIPAKHGEVTYIVAY